MIYYAIVFFIICFIYFGVSYKTKTLVNLLFYQILLSGILLCFFNAIRLYSVGNILEIRSGDVLYLNFILISFIGSAIIILGTKGPNIKIFNNKNTSNFVDLTIFVFLLMYWLFHYSDLLQIIVNPRMYYASSRLGGGFLYYVVIPFSVFLFISRLSKISFVNKPKLGVFKYTFLTLSILTYLFIFGQKSTFVLIFVLIISLIYYKDEINNVNKKIILLGIISTCIITALFYFYSAQQNIISNNIFLAMANYADYIANFNDLVDYTECFSYGQIFFEDEFLSLIPRSIWPEKPALFGSLELGLRIPRLVDWTLAKTGAPSFGVLGSPYADFGYLGIFFECFRIWLFVWIAKGFENNMKKSGYSLFNHLMIVGLCSFPVFYLTLSKLPLIQLFVLLFINSVCNIKLRR